MSKGIIASITITAPTAYPNLILSSIEKNGDVNNQIKHILTKIFKELKIEPVRPITLLGIWLNR